MIVFHSLQCQSIGLHFQSRQSERRKFGGTWLLIALLIAIGGLSGCSSKETVIQKPAVEETPSPGFSDS